MNVDERYLKDWSGLTRGVPSAVHRPTTTEEVAALVREADLHGRKITIQGGLTGLAGGAVPGDGDVVINMERMNRIESIDEVEGIMQVQAGATLQAVQEAAAEAGWFFRWTWARAAHARSAAMRPLTPAARRWCVTARCAIRCWDWKRSCPMDLS